MATKDYANQISISSLNSQVPSVPSMQPHILRLLSTWPAFICSGYLIGDVVYTFDKSQVPGGRQNGQSGKGLIYK
jgi:hypothetical protein